MSKKKRSANRRKQYKGSTAAFQPQVIKVSAVKRNKAHQWWVDNKRVAKPALMIAGIGFAVIIVIIGLIGLF